MSVIIIIKTIKIIFFHLIEYNHPVTVHDRVQSVGDRQHSAVQKLCPYSRLFQIFSICIFICIQIFKIFTCISSISLSSLYLY